ncbi:hypothetical protein BOTBODRAFT_39527 [Botryobasidium botryosum FD-172 SS1]|uniref:Uncharacterized protein n=1 Tax=Botryobasidium botryosum (strain FD-172 SS1) TaxID=930990 RepID=A0A067M4P6_BOTB1|nr:hypothetical protein BOTBODRAFT_39527 [Botryobasidium botryosum FD-172 SS1]
MPSKPAKNPFTRERLKSTVIRSIIVEMIIFSGLAAIITWVSKKYHNLGVNPQMITVLGTVIGFTITFRTTSAYDRYWEGRKLWTSFHTCSRNLAQIIWIHVPLENKKPADSSSAEDPQYRLKSIIEKKTMINVIEAMGPAVKLRDEPGILYEDLYPLLSGLPHFASPDPDYRNNDHTSPLLHYDDWVARNQGEVEPRLRPRNHAGPWRPTSEPNSFDTRADEKDEVRETPNPALHTNGQASSEIDLEKNPSVLFRDPVAQPDELKKARLPPPFRLSELIPILEFFKYLYQGMKRIAGGKEKREEERLARESKEKMPKDNIPLELCLFLNSYYAVLMERGSLQAATCTAFVNSLSALQDCMLNLERIKSTPIGYDLNDLNLDKFCKGISRELIQITAHQKMDPRKFVFSEWNRPLEPALGKGVTASTILNDKAYNVAKCEHVARGVLLSGHRKECLVDDSKKTSS